MTSSTDSSRTKDLTSSLPIPLSINPINLSSTSMVTPRFQTSFPTPIPLSPSLLSSNLVPNKTLEGFPQSSFNPPGFKPIDLTISGQSPNLVSPILPISTPPTSTLVQSTSFLPLNPIPIQTNRPSVIIPISLTGPPIATPVKSLVPVSIAPIRDTIGLPLVLTPSNSKSPGRLSISIAPGRQDDKHHRDIREDLNAIFEAGFETIVCLQEWKEFTELNTTFYPTIAQSEFGFRFLHFPIVDRKISSLENTLPLLINMINLLNAGQSIFMHCKGGLGRSGTIAACLAMYYGVSYENVISFIRSNRPGAIQTQSQKNFIKMFDEVLKSGKFQQMINSSTKALL